MESSVPEQLHRTSGSQAELLALARYWQWERRVRSLLPEVIAEGSIDIVFQPVFGLHEGIPKIHGYEALARFPAADSIPTGMWFRVASDMELSQDLEIAAALKAVQAPPRMLAESLLFLNASPPVAVDLASRVLPELSSRLVCDISAPSIVHGGCRDLVVQLREAGALAAVDDIPISDLAASRRMLTDLRPAFAKVDVISGLVDDPMARVDLAEAVIWSEEWGIRLIAERVENVADVQILYDLGVRLVQGNSLARPVRSKPDVGV